MRAHQLDANGVILRTIIVDSLSFMPGLIDANIGGQTGDRVVDGLLVPAAAAAIVPAKVTRRQARQALLLAGLLDKVQPAISGIADPVQRGMAQIEWDDSLEFERARPILVQVGEAIGLDSAGLDQLFITAARL